MKPFSFFKVGFKSRIERVSFAFYLDLAFDEDAFGVDSQTLFSCPFSSQVSPKKHQSRDPRFSKYFFLSQCELFSGCLPRAHWHNL
jgi:hypothetical protein